MREDIISVEEFFDLDNFNSGSILIDTPKRNGCDSRFEAAKKRLAERVGRLAENGRKNVHDKSVILL